MILVLPNSIFEHNHLIEKYPKHQVIIYEHPLFFTKHAYHKLKLIHHRATMKYYQHYLQSKYEIKVTYINFNQKHDFKKYDIIHVYDPIDHDIAKEFKKYANVFVHNTPLFIETLQDLESFHKQHPSAKHITFYNWQKKHLNIISNTTSHDKENRNPFPSTYKETYKISYSSNKYITEAQHYINKHFTKNFGLDKLYLPITFKDAKQHLVKFLKHRFGKFGTYEDAISSKVFLGNHSLISPLMNIGLITPEYVIDTSIAYAKKHHVKINELEAWVRQIIGWRSYIRYNYVLCHDQLIQNHFHHTRKLDSTWFTAKTNIPPVDTIIQKVYKYAYAHHIERLMIIGNFMLLSEIDPKHVIEWFYLFIDAYPWVMEPNVYGMSQYASTFMMTRPYFSSSNYILKMSDYSKHDGKKITLRSGTYHWSIIWNGLYYNFVNNHKKEFAKNYSTANAVKHIDLALVSIGKEYLKNTYS